VNKNNAESKLKKEGFDKKKRIGVKRKSAKEKEKSNKMKMTTAEEEIKCAEKMMNAIEKKLNAGKMKQEKGERRIKQQQLNELIRGLLVERLKCRTEISPFQLTKESTLASMLTSYSTTGNTLLRCFSRTAKVTSRVMVKDLKSTSLSRVLLFGSQATVSSPQMMLQVVTR